ncbi:AT-hook motif nuclear-localized protein 1-like isoform X1 [Zingiber officinale]|uniref:AT-hook motif nuclear-localized protein 1-like isoform X1 n=2 Tax=Zingiber officinale TaxID=94328 RepID=UPI001C4D8370|nr:AT-hook motif nuclear-localized protein 1-like isoform X1 [Zingiber officinale]
MEGVEPGGIAVDIVGGTEAKQYSASSTSSPSPPPSPPPAFPSVAIAGAHGMAAAPESAGLATGMMAGASDLFRGKKRGRPRKYGPDGMALALTSPSSGPPFSSGGKQSKGRPPGSGKNQLLAALGEWFAHSAGGNFTPHVVTISAGEDVAARILSFSQKGPQSICILSANGAISNVTLRQPGSSGGTLTYEGRFEILSLSGSFTLTENGGIRSRTGGISVSLAGPDGRVIGGGIAGTLLAASPIQVVVGSFTPNTFKDPKPKPTPQPPPEALPVTAGPLTAARPISQANPQVDCETPTSTLPVQPQVGSMDNPTPNPTLHAASWHGLQSSEHKASPDINICLHGEY